MSYNEKLGFHDETQALINRMVALDERETYLLHKPEAEETLLKTYDLFGLTRPKEIIWYKDVSRALSTLNRSWSALSAWSAWSALSALSALSAWSAWSTLNRLNRLSALSAWSAWSTLNRLNRLSTLSAWSIDYDFDYFVMANQYLLDPKNDKPNEHDYKYIEYSTLLLKAKEHGVGYWFQDNETLYLIPVPITRFDAQNRFHSDTHPAIAWPEGEVFYYLCGTAFDKDLWQKITSGELTAKDLAEITDVDQRKIAMTYLTGDDFVRETKARLINEGKPVFYEHLQNRRIKKYGDQNNKGVLVTNRLYHIAAGDLYQEDKYFLKYENPSTGQLHISFVTNFVKTTKDADSIMALKHNTNKKQFLAGSGA